MTRPPISIKLNEKVPTAQCLPNKAGRQYRTTLDTSPAWSADFMSEKRTGSKNRLILSFNESSPLKARAEVPVAGGFFLLAHSVILVEERHCALKP